MYHNRFSNLEPDGQLVYFRVTFIPDNAEIGLLSLAQLIKLVVASPPAYPPPPPSTPPHMEDTIVLLFFNYTSYWSHAL